MTRIRALILTGFGLNCDMETAFALQFSGAEAHRVHINALIDRSIRLDDFQILAFGGGFSWGDDHGAGIIQAVRMKTSLGDEIQKFIADGKLIIGICNGFQTLVNLELLPGFNREYRHRSVALTHNDCGNFRNDWVHLLINADSPCIFTRGLNVVDFPIRHGEGKFVAEASILTRLIDDQQVVMRYARPNGEPADGRFPFNPNGSLFDIAGICDPSGRIFGLMPHPEAFNDWTNHPQWTLMAEQRKRRNLPPLHEMPTPGNLVFKNAVEFFKT
jgi:phosphoribosylformylglycinamidine synthase